MKISTNKITYCGMFIAISVVLTRFANQMIYLHGFQAIRISFGQIPLMISGIVLGPVYGGICGALADLLGFPLNPQGSYFPGFTLSAALAGIIPAIILKLTKNKWNWRTLTIAVGISLLITSVILGTLWLYLIQGKAAIALLPVRLITCLITIPIYVIVINLSLKAFKHIKSAI